MAEREPLIKGVKFDVERATVRTRDGATVQREVVVHPGSVVVLPIDDRQRVVMIKNHRFAIDRTLWELPAGTLDRPGEDPAACARRELEEEAGFRAGRLDHLLAFYPVPGWCDERIDAYVARELTQVGQRLEPGEEITVEPLSVETVMEMVGDKQIEDGKTLVVLLYFHVFGMPGG